MFVKVIRSVILLCFINVSPSFSQIYETRIVTLPDGQIKGDLINSLTAFHYYAFQQIPYAAPPVGELRFKEPVPPQPWEGILDVTENTKICYQHDDFFIPSSVNQTEDCLYLNVYTPLIPVGTVHTILPVLVWIHGGAFIYGDGTFQSVGPQFFVESFFVVVTLNYRLGPLGFLTTEDGVIPGNLGLKDQNLALKWVNKNIHLFGGDPERVTIAGESAGGAAVGLQLISKESEGLFRSAIMQSVTPLTSTIIQRNARYFAFDLARALAPNFSSHDSTDLLTLLQSLPASDISKANIPIPPGKETLVGDNSGLVWAPVIENEELEGAFITGPVHEDIRDGNINQVPILLGFNSEEEITFLTTGTAELKREGIAIDNDLSKVINNNFNMSTEDKYIAGGKIREIYTDGLFDDDFGALVKFRSDVEFTTPTIRHADLQSSYTDVYLYQFSYKGLLGGLNIEIEDGASLFSKTHVECVGVDGGVGHAEELKYMWSDSTNSDITRFPAADILTRDRIVTLWSNFVKYTNPTPNANSLLENVTWEKVTPDNLVYLDINTSLELKTNPKNYQQYKEIIDEYAIPPLITY